MKDSWIKLYSTDQEYKAEVIKQLLEEHGLHPVVMDKRDDEFLIGTVHVYISPEEAEKAAQIIKENESKEA